jgi:hypothetical protein
MKALKTATVIISWITFIVFYSCQPQSVDPVKSVGSWKLGAKTYTQVYCTYVPPYGLQAGDTPINDSTGNYLNVLFSPNLLLSKPKSGKYLIRGPVVNGVPIKDNEIFIGTMFNDKNTAFLYHISTGNDVIPVQATLTVENGKFKLTIPECTVRHIEYGTNRLLNDSTKLSGTIMED